MKKIVTSAFLLSVSLAFSQSVGLVDDSTNTVSNTVFDIDIVPGSTVTTQILAANVSSGAKSVRVQRTIFSKDVQDSTQFCWGGLCYSYSQNTSAIAQNIAAGDTINFFENGFHAIFISGPATTVRTVHYTFFDDSNPSDSTGITLRYNSVTGISDQAASGYIMAAFPNPATTNVCVSYELSSPSTTSKIRIYDMVGTMVKEYALSGQRGTAKINVTGMPEGVYFYSLFDGRNISGTKKLIIAR